MTAFIDLPQGVVALGLTIAGAWTLLSILIAVVVGLAIRVRSDTV